MKYAAYTVVYLIVPPVPSLIPFRTDNGEIETQDIARRFSVVRRVPLNCAPPATDPSQSAAARNYTEGFLAGDWNRFGQSHYYGHR